MTKAEALAKFGINEPDRIHKDNVRWLLDNAERQIKVWSLTRDMREKLAEDIEAYKALLEE